MILTKIPSFRLFKVSNEAHKTKPEMALKGTND
jgi:hypothetical protein